MYKIALEYEYIVDGVKYLGSKLRLNDWWGEFGEKKQELESKFSEGCIVSVYYEAGKPTNAVLQRGVHLMTYVMLGAGFVFLFSTTKSLIVFFCS